MSLERTKLGYTDYSMGGMREHEGQPVLEAGASVYRLGPRCRTPARCTTYE